jgi:hypothetical protein
MKLKNVKLISSILLLMTSSYASDQPSHALISVVDDTCPFSLNVPKGDDLRPFSVSHADTHGRSIGDLESLVTNDIRRQITLKLPQKDLISYIQTCKKAFLEACGGLEITCSIDLEQVSIDMLITSLKRPYGKFEILKLKANDTFNFRCIVNLLPFCSKVTKLDLSDVDMGDDVSSSETEDSGEESFEKNISTNQSQDKAKSEFLCSVISHCLFLPNLESLSLGNMFPDGKGAFSYLLTSKRLPKLRELRLKNGYLHQDDDGIGDSLAETFKKCTLSNLEVLTLENNFIGDMSYQAIANSPNLQKLKVLNISNFADPFNDVGGPIDLLNLLKKNDKGDFNILPCLEELIIINYRRPNYTVPEEVQKARPDLKITTKKQD